MRAVLVALALLLVEVLALWIRDAVQRHRDRPAWQVASYAEHGRTTVALRLVDRGGTVVDEHVVACVPGDAFDWHRSLLQAQLEAEHRAMRLNGAR